MKKHLSAWSREPIIVPRWVLTAKYVAFTVLGILTVIGGIPTIALATFDSFTTFMSAGLVLASFVGTVASFRRDWEWVEKWAALSIAAILSTWAVAAIWRAASEGDVGRVAGAFAVVVVAMLPAARALDLLGKAGSR